MLGSKEPDMKPMTLSCTASKKVLAASTSTTATSYGKTEEEILLAPFEYIKQVPGKKIRSKLITAFNEWLHVPEDKMLQIGEITQMLHTASLLIDDIEDNSELRRGIPVAHNVYGVPHTINTGNYVYFICLQKTLELNHPQACHIFTESLLELHRGQGLELYCRDSYTCPTEAEYRRMVTGKTAALFSLGIQLLALFSEHKRDLVPLASEIGLYFQIRDDFASLTSKEYEAAKTYAEDLTEGKFSFPLIHAIQSKTDNGEIMNIIRKRTTDFNLKRHCVDLLEKLGSFAYTKRVLIELEESIFRQIKELGGNDQLRSIMNLMRKVYAEEY